MSDLVPQDHAEAIALFRSEIVGSLTRRELDRGDLSQALTELSQQRFRPPRAKSTKTYSVATLERWYYAYKSGGIAALRPSARSDRGRCRDAGLRVLDLAAAITARHPADHRGRAGELLEIGLPADRVGQHLAVTARLAQRLDRRAAVERMRGVAELRRAEVSRLVEVAGADQHQTSASVLPCHG